MLIFRKPHRRHRTPADAGRCGHRRRRAGGHGLCSAAFAAHRRSTTPQHPDSQLSKENIYVLEKAREIGQHCLSGALLDPRSMRELLPGFEKEAPLDAEVDKEAVYFLTEKWQVQVSHHAAAPARSRQLRHLAEPVCEVAGQQGGRDRHHGLHRLRRLGTALRRRSRHRRSHRRQGRGQREPAEIEFRARLRSASQGRHSRRRARADR